MPYTLGILPFLPACYQEATQFSAFGAFTIQCHRVRGGLHAAKRAPDILTPSTPATRRQPKLGMQWPSPDRALVSAAVSLSPAAAIWIASPPAVPLCDRCRPSTYSDFHVGTPPLTCGALGGVD